MNELLLTFGEDGELELYKEPAATLEFQTEKEWEDFKQEYAVMTDIKKIVSLDRLRELAQADREGRVVVFPFRIGQTLFDYRDYFEGSILPVVIKLQSDHIMVFSDGCLEYCGDNFFPSEIGKTIFFTREEAEKALEEMQK